MASYAEPGLGRAFRAPAIATRDAELLAGRPALWKVASHEPLRSGYRLVLTPEAGSSFPVDYWIGDGLRVPVDPNDQVLVSMTLDTRGFTVRSAEGALIALVSRDGAFTEEVGFTVDVTRDPASLVYTEAIDSHDGCREVLEHHEVVFRDGTTTARLSPGETRRLTLVDLKRRARLELRDEGADSAEFDLILLDASHQRRFSEASRDTEDLTRGGEPCQSRAHLTWVLLKVAHATK